MKLKNLLMVGSLMSGVVASTMAATVSVTADMSAADKAKVEQVIHDYLVKNPEVLLEASQVLQKKEQKNMQEKAKSAISQESKQLFNETLTVAGNPKGDVTLVEFFDYQCIHCKKMKPVVSELITKNPKLRVIYKEFPIFGDTSVYATKAAVAAAKQGKYMQMQDVLFKADKHLDNDMVLQAAKSIGLNMPQLKKDMDSPAVTAVVDANRKLAESMHLMGTPAFIVAATPNGQFKAGSEPNFIPGGASVETLQEMITQAQGK